jgi:hypothetical protein
VWNEQLVKRGTIDWAIPAAITPTVSWVWLAVLALAAVTVLVLRLESRSVDSPA